MLRAYVDLRVGPSLDSDNRSRSRRDPSHSSQRLLLLVVQLLTGSSHARRRRTLSRRVDNSVVDRLLLDILGLVQPLGRHHRRRPRRDARHRGQRGLLLLARCLARRGHARRGHVGGRGVDDAVDGLLRLAGAGGRLGVGVLGGEDGGGGGGDAGDGGEGGLFLVVERLAGGRG